MADTGPVGAVKTVTAPCSRQGPYRDTSRRPGGSKYRPKPATDRSEPGHGLFSGGSGRRPGQHPPILTVLTDEPSRQLVQEVPAPVGMHVGRRAATA